MTLTIGSLFSGIGGLELGLERAGMRVVWQVEKDPFCRRVLAKHWPEVRRHDDATTFPPGDGTDWRCDLVCGGFPCQDISFAGGGDGIDGARSGLWAEYARVVRLLRPRYVLVENVAAMLARGLGRVLGDLAACGYDAEWDCVPAAAVGAPHVRDRVFVLAYPQGVGGQLRSPARGRPWRPSGRRFAGVPPHADRQRREEQHVPALAARAGKPGGGSDADVGDTDGTPANAHSQEGPPRGATGQSGWWAVEPAVGRVANGVPDRVDRLRALGNAVVPQVAEWIGRRIIEFHCGLEKGGAA